MDKKILLSQAKIVSLSKDGKWSQAVSFDSFSFCLEIAGSAGFETPLLGKQLIEEIQKKYLESEEKNLALIKELLELIQEKNSPDTLLNSALCLQNGLILYLGTFGKAKILIKRGDQLRTILSGEEDLVTASGFLKDQDKIILETASFSNVITEEKLKLSLDGRKSQEIADILAPEIQAKEDFGGAGIVIEVKIETAEDESKELEEKPEGVEVKSNKLEEGREEVASVEYEVLGKKEPTEEKRLTKIKSFISNKFSGLKEKLFLLIPSRPLYIRGPQVKEEKKRKITTTVAGILILLLFISIVFNLKKKTLSEAERKFNDAYQIAQKKQEEGKTLIDLNPIRSRTLFEDGKKTLEEVKPLLLKNKKLIKKLDQLLSEINSELEIVARVYHLKELNLFFDLTLIKDKAKSRALSIGDKNLYAYDSFNRSLYSVNIPNKSQEILAGGKDLENGKSLTFLNGKVYLLTDKSVYQVDSGSQEKRIIVKFEKEQGEIVDISSFPTNFYLLDKKNKRIWKYVLSEAGAALKNYLAEGLTPDFSDSVSLTIDGAVYVLKKNSEILKFIQGNLDPFKISGLDINLSNPKKIFTTVDLKNIYLLDSGNKRVVVIDKKGEYQSQYVNEEIGKAEDLVIDKEEKKIYLISGSKIFEIEIK